MDTTKIAIFKGRKIRRTIYNNEWWFVIADIVAALTDSVQPDGYMKDMRRRDPELSKGWVQIATPLSIQDDLELIFTMLGERSTTEIHRNEDSKGVTKLKADASAGGNIAGNARKALEKRLKRPIVSRQNYLIEKESQKKIKNIA